MAVGEALAVRFEQVTDDLPLNPAEQLAAQPAVGGAARAAVGAVGVAAGAGRTAYDTYTAALRDLLARL